jgi:hypothetical protein
MTILNLLPEWMIVICIFVSLIMVSFRVLSTGVLIPLVSAAAIASLAYFFSRTDLAHFDPVIPMICSDSLSYFGRLLALLVVAVFSLGFHFHRSLSVRERQKALLFILFYSLFLCSLFLSQSLVLFVSSALGIYFCSMNLVLIESRGGEHWLRLFRFKAVSLGFWVVLALLLFVLSGYSFGSFFFNDWFEAMGKGAGTEWGHIMLVLLVVLVGVLPLAGLRFIGEAPVGLGVHGFGQMLVLQAFWFRVGIPFLNASPVLPKGWSQWMLAAILGGITLRSVYFLVRTRNHHTWVSSLFPILVGMSLFVVVLPSEKALPAFYLLALSYLFTFSLISQAFLDQDYHFKGLIVLALIAAVGAPPLVMGERFYRLIHEIIETGNFLAGILMVVVWFGVALGATQIIGKVLLVRVSGRERRQIHPGEVFFLVVFLVGVITLTTLQGQLIALLNEHPPLNLW